MKRTFIKKFENNFQRTNVAYMDSHELVTKAKEFIRNIPLKIPKYRIMEPKEVDIIPGIEKYLLKEYKGTKKDFFPCCLSFNIAGYDGIYEDYLLPIFIEIRSNAEKALSQIPKEKRHYQVNLKYGKNDYSGYGILSVTNNFSKKSETSDPASTGIGRKNIQDFANFFQQGSRMGWAEFKPEERKKYNFFIVNIFFPLWQESGKDK